MSSSVSTPPIPFDSLSPIEQRRAIVVDVIKQIKARRVIARRGAFLILPTEEDKAQVENDLGDESRTLRQFLATHGRDTKPCQVCALGGIMLSQLDLNGDSLLCEVTAEMKRIYLQPGDEVPIRAVSVSPFVANETNRWNEHFSPFMLRYFTEDQLVLIEIAFECGRGAFACRHAVEEWREDGVSDEYDEQAPDNGYAMIKIEDASKAIAFGEAHELHEPRLIAIMQSIASHPEALFDPLASTAT